MSLRFEANSPETLPEEVSLLREVFGAAQDAPNMDPSLLRWKYYEPGPEWEGSRSYAIRKGEAMVAHACLWPIRLATPSGTVQGIQALDWAGSKAAPGAGIILMRKFGEMAQVLITMGGSEDTQKILPKIGFAQRGSIGLFARVLRPWRQFRTRPSEGRKAIPRLLRNAQWSRSPLAATRDWTSQEAVPNSELLSAAETPTASRTGSCYSAAFLQFMLRCPAAKIRYFCLLKHGIPQGFFVLSRIGGQMRLADLRLLSSQPEDWNAAYAVASRAALQDPEACELIAAAPVPLVASALEANGFRHRGSKPVFIRDPKQVLGDETNIHLSMLDEDSSILNFPQYPYAT